MSAKHQVRSPTIIASYRTKTAQTTSSQAVRSAEALEKELLICSDLIIQEQF
jgi:hypothetical protein